MRNLIILLVATTFLSCGLSGGNVDSSNGSGNKSDFVQFVEIIVDGVKTTIDKDDILTMSFINPSNLGISVMSEKKDIQFSISAKIGELKIGTYQVFDCKGPSQCKGQENDRNENAIYGPYPPSDGTIKTNLYRMAYLAPDLGLKPLNLTISSITDEQQLGNPMKTKRVKGQFEGILGYAEQEVGGYNYKLVGKTKEIKGQFDLYCNIM